MTGLVAWIVGQTLSGDELAAASETCVARWQQALVHRQDGACGWYRVLDQPGRIGVVASAQGLLALLAANVAPANQAEIITTLEGAQRTDGSWSFVSTLNQEGVVDATAWAVMALARVHALGTQAPSVIDGSRWLVQAELQGGGWGIVAGGPFRCCSTSLAIRALVDAGTPKNNVVLARGLQRLSNARDTVLGAWAESDGPLSVSTTSDALLALACFENTPQARVTEIDEGSRWLQEVAQPSQSWVVGGHLGTHEEVEVGAGLTLRRVEYGHSSRALGVSALAKTVAGLDPTTIVAARELTLACRTDDWQRASGNPGSQGRLTSWQLHDVAVAIELVRARLDAQPRPVTAVWTNGRRAISRSVAESSTRWWLRRYLRVACVAAAIFAVVVVGLTVTQARSWYLVVIGFVLALLSNILAGLIINALDRREGG